MIHKNILTAILKDDSELAKNLWNSKESECHKVLKTSKLKNHFIRLITEKDDDNIRNREQLDSYLENALLLNKLKSNFSEKISQSLSEHGIHHILFKGSALSKIFYEHPVDRIYSDIDILISTEDSAAFYDYLEVNRYKNRKNIELIDRFGYTRTALEVLNIENITVDFHHRIFSKFFSRECELSKDILLNIQSSNKINHTTPELNIALVVYHACIQNNFALDPYYLLDISKIMKTNELSENHVVEVLQKYSLHKQFLICLDLINKIENNLADESQIKKLFTYKSFINHFTLRTQIRHFIDPIPYMNFISDSADFNYLDFLKHKFIGLKNRFF